RVDLPWSMCAMMQKLRIRSWGDDAGRMSRASSAAILGVTGMGPFVVRGPSRDRAGHRLMLSRPAEPLCHRPRPPVRGDMGPVLHARRTVRAAAREARRIAGAGARRRAVGALLTRGPE